MTKKINKCYTLQSQLKHGNSEKWITMPSHSFMGKQFALGVWSMVKSQYGGNLRYRMIESDSGVVVETWQCPNAGVPDTAPVFRDRTNLIKSVSERGDFVAAEDGYIYFAPKGGHMLAPHQLRWIADELDKRNRDWDQKVNEL